jgi:CBS domain-containing protein
VITIEDVGIASYGERAVGRLRFDLQVVDVMTRPVRSVRADASVREAAEALLGQPFRALPVVDEDGLLIGIVSRADVLRAVAEAFPAVEPEPGTNAAAGGGGGAGSTGGGAAGSGGRFARDVMRSPAPTVDAEADLPAVLDAVCSTRLNRAVVVEASGAVVGVVSDWTVLRALGPEGSSVVGRLMGMAAPGRAPNRTARELVVGPDVAVSPETPLSDVARLMTEHRRKIVPVVDAERRLLGIIDRADLLAATHAALSDLATAETVDDED